MNAAAALTEPAPRRRVRRRPPTAEAAALAAERDAIDRALLTRYRAGPPGSPAGDAALVALLVRAAPRCAAAWRKLRVAPEAWPDLHQEVALRALEALTGGEEVDLPGAWLVGIAKHTALEWREAEQRHGAVARDELPDVAAPWECQPEALVDRWRAPVRGVPSAPAVGVLRATLGERLAQSFGR